MKKILAILIFVLLLLTIVYAQENLKEKNNDELKKSSITAVNKKNPEDKILLKSRQLIPERGISETVKTKIKNAECIAGNPNNGLMAFLKYVICVIKNDKNEKLIIERDKKYGGNLIYDNYISLEKDFVSKKLHSLDLKNALSKEINLLLLPIRKQHKELSKLHKAAY